LARPFDLSVIVCTFNRAEVLARSLGQLARQRAPAGLSWEVVVVDNNCTDHTAEVVRQFGVQGRVPLRRVREEKQGLCHARNRGIAETNGAVIAYLDDDILADPSWLAGVTAVFAETRCDAAGGPIYLETEGRPLPPWLTAELWGYLGYIDHGNERTALDGRRHYPHGGNMAFRREVFHRIGLFDVGIGRTGNKLYKGSETEFFHRLAPTCSTILYEPTASVRHLIKARELTKAHFRTLQLRIGEQRSRRHDETYRRSWMGIPPFIGVEFLKGIRRYVRAVPSGAGRRFRREMDLWEMAGFAYGCFRERNRARSNRPGHNG